MFVIAMRYGGLPLFALLVVVNLAHAQDTTIEVGTLYTLLSAFLLPIITVLAAAIAGWLANLLRVKFGLQIEEQHRNALQTALTNAAGLAIAKGADLTAGKKLDVKSVPVAAAVDYVVAAVPDALKYFGITPEAVAEKIAAKLGVVQAPHA